MRREIVLAGVVVLFLVVALLWSASWSCANVPRISALQFEHCVVPLQKPSVSFAMYRYSGTADELLSTLSQGGLTIYEVRNTDPLVIYGSLGDVPVTVMYFSGEDIILVQEAPEVVLLSITDKGSLISTFAHLTYSPYFRHAGVHMAKGGNFRFDDCELNCSAVVLATYALNSEDEVNNLLEHLGMPLGRRYCSDTQAYVVKQWDGGAMSGALSAFAQKSTDHKGHLSIIGPFVIGGSVQDLQPISEKYRVSVAVCLH